MPPALYLVQIRFHVHIVTEMTEGSSSIDKVDYVWRVMLPRSEGGARNTSVNSVN